MAARNREAGPPSPFRPEAGLVLALGAAVEAAASYPWYLLLHYTIDAPQTAAVGPGSLLLFAFAAALLGVVLARRGTPASLSRWVTGPGGVLFAVGWLALTPVVWRGSLAVSAAALLWNWHRGLRLAWDEEDHGLALHRFAMAVVRAVIALAAGLLFRGWGEPAALRAAGLGSGLALLLSGLLLLAVTHQAEVRKGLAARGSLAADRPRFWGSVALITTVLALAVALEGSRLLSSLPPALLRGVLTPFAWLLEHVVEGLLRIIVAVFGPLMLGLLWLLRRMSTTLITLRSLVPGQNLAAPPPEVAAIKPVALVWRAVAMLVLAVLAAALLARAATRRSRERELDEGLVEVHESLWDWANLAPGSWLDALRAWLRARSGESDGAAGSVREPIGPTWDVRRLYRRFLVLGDELGRGRQLGETPRQYQEVFTATFDAVALPALPAEPTPAQAVTRAYEAVRYGEQEPDPVEVTAVRTQLAKLEAAVADRPQPHKDRS